MNRIIVIADDITGAAEIAGIAHRYGLKTTLSISPSSPLGKGQLAGVGGGWTEGGAEGLGEVDVIVIATDARSYSAEEAARMTKEALKCLTVLPSDHLFHKVDSALRGNVKAQLDALGGEWIYMPANPSKGRIIKDGIYYITSPEGGLTPLHETDFRFDPEFPAWSSKIEERFPGIRYANAETRKDVDKAVEQALAEGLLLAGAADLFEALLRKQGKTPAHNAASVSLHPRPVIVCGSTQSKALDLGIKVETMPLDVFYEKAKPVTWTASILSRNHDGGIILTIGDKEVRPGKAAAVYLRNAMAEVTCAMIEAIHPGQVVIEGGATAFAILSQLPYSTFKVTAEIAPGVVGIQPVTADGSDAPSFVMKPGSYSWGNLFA